MYTEMYETLLKQRADQAAFEGKTSLMLWELYRRDGESMEEAHHRLFENMSPATGSMRLYQLASAQLLHEFDAICQREGIAYWMVSGTLLGAVRHKGFIPWDDDLDVGMTRQDIDRLSSVLPENGRYRVTARFDRNALCRQVRFAYADETIP
ncbi:MAG: LicD family protein, partial [Atopobiaceae bacterium]|nr:LicD family protein [Atopobiaceae bacterium]